MQLGLARFLCLRFARYACPDLCRLAHMTSKQKRYNARKYKHAHVYKQ